MPGWNYRVMRRTVKSENGDAFTEIGVYETYYDENGKPTGSSVDPEDVRTFDEREPGDTENMHPIAELRRSLLRMLDSLNKPVLDYETYEVVSLDGIDDITGDGEDEGEP